MVSAPMITRKNTPLFLFDVRVLVSAVAVAYLAGTACNSAALLAPTNSTISLTAGNRILPNGGTTQLLATVLENSGQPVPNGTTVRFTASMGRVDPVEAETNNGVAVATFVAGSESGVAEIRAISGLASGGTGTTTTPGTGGTPPTSTTAAANVVQITIGAAAARGIRLSANPGTVRPSGSSVEISAFVNDADGNPVRSVAVTFTTTRGTINPAIATTDNDGVARTTLTASETATVTGRVGGGSGGGGTTTPGQPPTGGTGGTTDSIEVRTATTPSFTLATAPPSPVAGQPVILTITPGTSGTGTTTATSAPTVTVNWGDGTTEAVGVVSAARSVTHTYAAPGFYTITATGTQEGESFSNSTAVTVSSPPPVSLTVNPTTADVGVPITFTITPTVGALIQNITINYGDGQTETLGAVSTQNTRTHQYSSPGVYVVTVTQVEVSGRQTTATTTVTITI